MKSKKINLQKSNKRKNNPKAICILSGGLDSTVMTGLAKSKKFDLYCIFFDYGQKTVKKERMLFNKIADYYKATEKKIVKLPWLKEMGGSALTDKKTKLTQANWNSEYVPFRNSIFLSISVAWAEVIGADVIFIGSTGGDRICPDNSRTYIDAMQMLIQEGTKIKKDIKLEAPLLVGDKKYVIKIGKKINAPFGLTWSCHNNNNVACGACSNCVSRLNAFKENEMIDPIRYKNNC
jgi:7-cyano-7-deazaguanine synthase